MLFLRRHYFFPSLIPNYPQYLEKCPRAMLAMFLCFLMSDYDQYDLHTLFEWYDLVLPAISTGSNLSFFSLG